MNKEIPQEVKEAASFLIDLYGDSMVYIGKYQDSDVYQYLFPEGIKTGFPFVFLYNGAGVVQKITGEKTFSIIRTAKGVDNQSNNN